MKVDPSKLIYLEAFDNLQILSFVNVEGLNDSDLAILNGLDSLRSLTFESTPITGSGFRRVALPNLATLFLTNSLITDEGLKGLSRAKFPSLSVVYLSHTKVTNDGINVLSGLEELRQVDVKGTDVTKAGAEKLDQTIKRNIQNPRTVKTGVITD